MFHSQTLLSSLNTLSQLCSLLRNRGIQTRHETAELSRQARLDAMNLLRHPQKGSRIYRNSHIVLIRISSERALHQPPNPFERALNPI